MLKSQVKIGSYYLIRHHDGNLTPIKIIGTREGGWLSKKNFTWYMAVKLSTGRVIIIKSAAKLRKELSFEEAVALYRKTL